MSRRRWSRRRGPTGRGEGTVSKSYKIGEACRAVDIQPYVLRYWETEFTALKPPSNRAGQRVYTESEVTVIRRIKELLYDEGYTIAGAKKRLQREIGDGKIGAALAPGEDEEQAATPEAAAQAVEEATEERLPSEIEVVEEPELEAAADEDLQQIDVERQGPETVEGNEPEAEAPADTAADGSVDSRLEQRVETLEQGLAQVLEQLRELLATLEAEGSGSKK